VLAGALPVFCGMEHGYGIFTMLSEPEYTRQISSQLLKADRSAESGIAGKSFHMMSLYTSTFFASLYPRRRTGHEPGICPNIKRHSWRPECTHAKTVRPPEQMVARGESCNFKHS
jgi:hypothetical protein